MIEENQTNSMAMEVDALLEQMHSFWDIQRRTFELAMAFIAKGHLSLNH